MRIARALASCLLVPWFLNSAAFGQFTTSASAGGTMSYFLEGFNRTADAYMVGLPRTWGPGTDLFPSHPASSLAWSMSGEAIREGVIPPADPPSPQYWTGIGAMGSAGLSITPGSQDEGVAVDSTWTRVNGSVGFTVAFDSWVTLVAELTLMSVGDPLLTTTVGASAINQTTGETLFAFDSSEAPLSFELVVFMPAGTSVSMNAGVVVETTAIVSGQGEGSFRIAAFAPTPISFGPLACAGVLVGRRRQRGRCG